MADPEKPEFDDDPLHLDEPMTAEFGWFGGRLAGLQERVQAQQAERAGPFGRHPELADVERQMADQPLMPHDPFADPIALAVAAAVRTVFHELAAPDFAKQTPARALLLEDLVDSVRQYCAFEKAGPRNALRAALADLDGTRRDKPIVVGLTEDQAHAILRLAEAIDDRAVDESAALDAIAAQLAEPGTGR